MANFVSRPLAPWKRPWYALDMGLVSHVVVTDVSEQSEVLVPAANGMADCPSLTLFTQMI